ncbi:glutaminase A [Microbacterium trichothecenolyticum]|uniref:Glutaminase n=1 Tax=Microbacterium trichothecenolyticum TaxID=69370 RepID=A0A0M2H6G3_MICTR|nr:glutaminase A [Microbacterium trichothecenolyticum]KJL39668.1 Glutaminase 2 [Microbacterium trichothecenolyticum]
MDPITALLHDVLEDIRPHDDGAPAGYIPELAAADPDRLALAVVGPRGRVRAVGDVTHEFTIQSISKPFVLALALADRGRDAVLRKVGAEPSGEPFNAISLEPGTGRPANPMVNAGAIATSALIPGDGVDDRMTRIVEGLSAFAGRSLWVDEQVYASESATGDRNRALAHLLRSHGIIEGSVEIAVETYFRQCSLLVTVRDLAVMSATLAFGGLNPVTGERVVSEAVARDVLSIMASCGMYDYSGEWLLRVGLPAKSGVSGGLLAVAPSQFGVAAFSPRLDEHGNSVRAIALLETLGERFGMHLLEPHESVAVPAFTVEDTDQGRVLRLSGELGLAGTERVVAVLREIAEALPEAAEVIVDARDLARAHSAALVALRVEFEQMPSGIRLRE